MLPQEISWWKTYLQHMHITKMTTNKMKMTDRRRGNKETYKNRREIQFINAVKI
jgi:hypothetical protein